MSAHSNNQPYTVEQMQLALTVIAQHAVTLNDVLMSLQEQFGKHQDLCAYLGGCEVHGGGDRRHCG